MTKWGEIPTWGSRSTWGGAPVGPPGPPVVPPPEVRPQAGPPVPVEQPASVHLAVPFRISGDRAVTVDDGSIDEITQNVAVIVGTLRGQRLVVPEFGTGDPTFELGSAKADPVDLKTSVARWEQRAALAIDRTVMEDGEEDLVVSVSLQEGR